MFLGRYAHNLDAKGRLAIPARYREALAEGVVLTRGIDRCLALYPLALGLGSFDPYEWGWHFSPLFVIVAALTVWLTWKQNRFGFLLLLAAVAFHLRLLESTNYWDYVLDPIYCLVSFVVLIRHQLSADAHRRVQQGTL